MALEKVSGLWPATVNPDTGKKPTYIASGKIVLDAPATFIINIKDGTKKVTFPAGEVGVLVFKNDFKKEDRHPTSNLCLVMPDGPTGAQGVDDDIPF